MLLKRGGKINKERLIFIIVCCFFPVLNWLIFYVYANLSSFTMAFTTKEGIFTLENFVRLWNELQVPAGEIREAIRNTAKAFVVMVVMYPVGVMVSYFIYKKIPFANVYRILFFIPSIVCSVVLAMVILRMFGINGVIAQTVQKVLDLDYTPELFVDSRFANKTIFAHMIWMSIPGDLIIWGGTFARIPEDMLEAARMDGVNWWQEFTKIIVPIIWPTVALKMVLLVCGIFSASGNVFLFTQGKYGTQTLKNWMYMQVYGVSVSPGSSNVFNYMSAVGLVMTVIAIGISLVVRKWTDKAFTEVEF